MKHIYFSLICIALTLMTVILYAAGYAGNLLFLPLVTGFIFAVGAFKTNAASILSIGAGTLNGISAAAIFYLLTGDYFIPIAIILAAHTHLVKAHILNFNYTRNLWIEPFLALVSVGLYVAGNLKGQFGWTAWVYPAFPVFIMAFVNIVNYLDRVRLRNTPDKYISTGIEAPGFTLEDENGNKVSLSDYKGKPVLLVFVRGDWCPGCHIMLRSYEMNREKLLAKDVTLLTIGPDSVGVNKKMAEKIGVHFHILSDPDQQVAMQYTVELQSPAPPTPKEYKGIPLPASFLLDKDGVIRHTSRVEDAGEVLQPHKIIQTLESLA
ncbi:MAG: peroxiredoxin family protein [Bacteroidia bacterium]